MYALLNNGVLLSCGLVRNEARLSSVQVTSPELAAEEVARHRPTDRPWPPISAPAPTRLRRQNMSIGVLLGSAM